MTARPPATTTAVDAFEPFRAWLAAPAGGTIGVTVVDPADGAVPLEVRGDELFPAASVIKLPLVMALYADAAAGRVDLAERVAVGQTVGGSGLLGMLRDVGDLSLHDLAVLAIEVSDNTAANRIIDRLGPERVTERMREWGCTRGVLGRRLYDLDAKARGRENLMTPAETAGLLVRLVRGECADRATSDAVLRVLEYDQSHTPLARYLPDGRRIAHKPGWMDGVRGDAAVIWGARPVVVAAFGRDLPTVEAAAAPYAVLGWCAYRWAGGDAPPLPPGALPVA